MSSVVDEISSLLKENDLICFESESESHSVLSNSLQPHGLYSPWNSLGKNTGVGSLLLLQGIFPTQGSNLGLPPCRQILYQLSHKGSPRSCFKYIIIWCSNWCPFFFKSESWNTSNCIILWFEKNFSEERHML